MSAAAARLARWVLGGLFIYLGLSKVLHGAEFLKYVQEQLLVRNPFFAGGIAAVARVADGAEDRRRVRARMRGEVQAELDLGVDAEFVQRAHELLNKENAPSEYSDQGNLRRGDLLLQLLGHGGNICLQLLFGDNLSYFHRTIPIRYRFRNRNG